MARISCRKAFTSELLTAGKKDFSLYTIAMDSRGSVTSNAMFEQLGEQTVEMGIAEQNAITVGAGLALTGKNVFVCGPACFLTGRGFEQIKIDVAYNETNVKLIGVSAGVSYGPLGTTHNCLHDFAGMRCLPEIEIFAPSDAVQTRFLTRYLAQKSGPAYMRMGRGDVEEIYAATESFEIGKAKTLKHGKDVTLIACGELVYQALLAAQKLEKDGISATVLDAFSLYPFDAQTVVNAAKATGAVMTIEEHSIFGGLGELVAHTLVQSYPVPMRILGFPHSQCRIGTSDELFSAYGLDATGIVQTTRQLVRSKTT